MMKFLFSFGFLFLITQCRAQQPGTPVPDAKQRAWQDKPFYLFMHFGPNTFTDLEWGKGTEHEAVFNPAKMDCRQWCRIARDAGATGIIITAKHHDGFCLWPSKYSNHTVAQSSWRNGHGDVLKELSAACREYELSFGVYLSPWDRNHPAYGTPAYNEVFVNMMKEVVAAYGPFFEFWWDGANGEGPNGKMQRYDWQRFQSTMRRIAPNTVLFSDIGPDARWVGNENGQAGTTNWNLLDTAGFSRGAGAPPTDTLNQGNVNGKNWIPAECDISIRPGWFYHQREDTLVKTPDSLFGIYLKSVGRGANLVLNVPPDRNGLISPFDSVALMQFAQLRKISFGEGKNLLVSGKHQLKWDQHDSMEILFDSLQWVNCIGLREQIEQGQQVKSFSLEFYADQERLYQKDFTTIGHLRLISFPALKVNRIVLKITAEKSRPHLYDPELYHIPDQLVEK